MIHEGNLGLDRETYILTGSGIPCHRCTLIAQIAHHEWKAVVLDADRHLHRFRCFSLQFYDDGHHRIRHFAHSCVIEICIICSTGNAILNVLDSLDENGRVIHLYVAIIAYHMQAIMAFCHVLAIRILLKQDIHTLTHEDSRRDAVLLGCLPLVLSIETINDITHIINRDDALVLRETHIISLRLVLQVVQSGKTL